MNATSLLREQLQQAHQSLETVMADVTPEQAHWCPPGIANPIGATYAHVLMGEDLVINILLQSAPPLFATSWTGKIGLSALPPLPAPGSQSLPSWKEWGRTVQIDLGALREYAQAVYTRSDDYLTSLPDEALSRPLDLTVFSAGSRTVAWALSNSVLGHVQRHCGEIACLKGLQGIRGYLT